jgi:hypothetical protein
MAGFWNNSFQQLHDLNGEVLVGAKAYFYEASTLDPITVYQDYGLGTAHPNPVVSNGRGIFPAVFLDEADGFYRVRMTNADGELVEGTDSPVLPIIGPNASEGGAEVPVDANAILKTGDFFWQPASGSRSGFVRANARTIGSSTSGASERANADCEQLFLFLWGTFSDTICPVSGGRGVSAAADWAANKPIGTPNARNKAPFGLPDMGNSDSGEFDTVTFSVGSKTTAMSQGGDANLTIVTGNLPPYTPAGSIVSTPSPGTVAIPSGGSIGPVGGVMGSTTLTVTSTFTGTPQGGTSTPMDKMPPFMLGTWYVKL